MSTTTGIPINQLPGLGAVTDDSYVVGEHAGSGLFSALALRSYAAVGGGRNYVQNSGFVVQQRGAGSWSASGYTVDRWRLGLSLDTSTVAAGVASDTARAQIGDEAATSYINLGVVGNAGAASSTVFYQPIEGVRRLAGKTVTVSFWASQASGLKLGVSVSQYFGSGGSPSAQVVGTGQSVTLASGFARYSLTFAIPSVSGKTLGTNNDDCTQLQFWGSAGANSASASGNVGVQTGNIFLWGVQLEVGSTATPYDYGGSPADVLRQCQRFYAAGSFRLTGYQGAGSGAGNLMSLPSPMRANPVVTPTYTTQTNCTGTVAAQDAQTIFVSATVTAQNPFVMTGTYTASAEL